VSRHTSTIATTYVVDVHVAVKVNVDVDVNVAVNVNVTSTVAAGLIVRSNAPWDGAAEEKDRHGQS
jgi:hypothetical protein